MEFVNALREEGERSVMEYLQPQLTCVYTCTFVYTLNGSAVFNDMMCVIHRKH